MTRSKIKMYIRSHLWHRHSVRNNVTMNLLISTFVTITGPITTVFGLLVPECFIHPVVSVSALPWFNIYIYIYSNYRTSDATSTRFTCLVSTLLVLLLLSMMMVSTSLVLLLLTMMMVSTSLVLLLLSMKMVSTSLVLLLLSMKMVSTSLTSNVLTKHVNLVLVVESPLSNMT
jgi:hypothetical protein